MVALLEVCDVTSKGRHLGGDLWILPGTRNQVETARNGDFFVLDMKNNT